MDPCTHGSGVQRSSIRLLDYLRGVVNLAGCRLNESLKLWESSASLTAEDLGKIKPEKYTSESEVTAEHRKSTNRPAECVHKCHSTISSWRHTSFVHCSDVPEKLREPYIEYGYLLPFMPWRYYLRGLFIPCYELSNVWTHLLPGLYFIYLLFTFSYEMDIIHAWPLFLITLSAIAVCGFSSTAHLFHARSTLHHSCWFVADYFGITLYAFSSMASNFYSGAKLEYYKWLSPYYLHIITAISVVGFTSLCVTQTKQTWISLQVGRQLKLAINGLGYAFGALPLMIRMYETSASETALQYHLLAIISMMIAPITYGSDFPQRCYPGVFDMFGHSHMWFHVFTASAMYFDVHAIRMDVLTGPWRTISAQEGLPTITAALFYYFLVMMCGIISGHLTHCAIKRDYKEEDVFLQGKRTCACGIPKTIRLAKEPRKQD